MIDASPKKGLAVMGISTGMLLGLAGTLALLFTAAAPLLAVLNALIFVMTAGIILIWLRIEGLPDSFVWGEIAGFTVLEIAICVLCVMG
jgi:uncharacterized membrane protein HdeD (DUF308 family)